MNHHPTYAFFPGLSINSSTVLITGAACLIAAVMPTSTFAESVHSLNLVRPNSGGTVAESRLGSGHVFQIGDVTVTVTGFSDVTNRRGRQKTDSTVQLQRGKSGLGLRRGRNDNRGIDGHRGNDTIRISFSEDVQLLSADFGYSSKQNRSKQNRSKQNRRKRNRVFIDSISDSQEGGSFKLPKYTQAGIGTLLLDSDKQENPYGSVFEFSAIRNFDNWLLAGIDFSTTSQASSTSPGSPGSSAVIATPAPAAAGAGLLGLVGCVARRRRAPV